MVEDVSEEGDVDKQDDKGCNKSHNISCTGLFRLERDLYIGKTKLIWNGFIFKTFEDIHFSGKNSFIIQIPTYNTVI